MMTAENLTKDWTGLMARVREDKIALFKMAEDEGWAAGHASVPVPESGAFDAESIVASMADPKGEHEARRKAYVRGLSRHIGEDGKIRGDAMTVLDEMARRSEEVEAELSADIRKAELEASGALGALMAAKATMEAFRREANASIIRAFRDAVTETGGMSDNAFRAEGLEPPRTTPATSVVNAGGKVAETCKMIANELDAAFELAGRSRSVPPMPGPVSAFSDNAVASSVGASVKCDSRPVGVVGLPILNARGLDDTPAYHHTGSSEWAEQRGEAKKRKRAEYKGRVFLGGRR